MGAGSYGFLPLGVRVLGKLERIVREEMGRAGAEEIPWPRERWSSRSGVTPAR
jgi:prolyl-tRNA synthetase